MRRAIAALLVFAALLTAPALALTEEEMQTAAEAAGRAAIAACVTEDMTDLETLTALHDWLALHCEYGATLRGETAYGALVESTGNCVGYAEGYACLAALAGLDGVRTYSEALDHAWILATLDGGRYFSDCTWDDGKCQRLGLIRHAYFLFGMYTAEAAGHSGWDSTEVVPGGLLETVPWREAVTRVIFDGDYAYYFNGDFALCRCDRVTWETEVLMQREERWPTEASGKTELYSGLILVRQRLYFNTPGAICYYDLQTGQTRTALTVSGTDLSVYGIGARNGTLCYSLAENAALETDFDIVDTHISLYGAWGY